MYLDQNICGLREKHLKVTLYFYWVKGHLNAFISGFVKFIDNTIAIGNKSHYIIVKGLF